MGKKRPRYTLEFKQEAVRLVTEEDMSYAEVGSDLGVDKSTIRAWCKKAEAGALDGGGTAKAPLPVEEELAQLRRENRILREEREILKSSGLLRPGEPVTTYRFIRTEEANHTVRLMCRVLCVSRSAYYVWRGGQTHSPTSSDAKLLVHIKAIHRRHHGRYGSPRVTAELREQGFMVNRKRVARVMRTHGIVGRPRRVFRGTTTDSDHDETIAPNLLERQFATDAPNKAFVGDITYLRTQQGWVYLAVLIDLFSRKVVGWAMDETMQTSLCLRALDRLRATRGDVTGAVHHTDRGSQYASAAYRKALTDAGLRPSMSRKGNCWDNAVAESFFGTLEQELVPDTPWRGLTQARRAVSNYIHRYYNAARRHSTLGYQAPVAFEAQYQAAETAAA